MSATRRPPPPARKIAGTFPSMAAVRPNVVVRGNSYVEVHGCVSVQATENAVVAIYGDSDAIATGNATVITWSGHARVKLADSAVWIDRSGRDPVVHSAKESDQ
jgi:hypothetical protein